jgi:hypothetical protein
LRERVKFSSKSAFVEGDARELIAEAGRAIAVESGPGAMRRAGSWRLRILEPWPRACFSPFRWFPVAVPKLGDINPLFADRATSMLSPS